MESGKNPKERSVKKRKLSQKNPKIKKNQNQAKEQVA